MGTLAVHRLGVVALLVAAAPCTVLPAETPDRLGVGPVVAVGASG